MLFPVVCSPNVFADVVYGNLCEGFSQSVLNLRTGNQVSSILAMLIRDLRPLALDTFPEKL